MSAPVPAEWTFDRMVEVLVNRQPADPIWIPKAHLPELPDQFTATWAGTPLWIAQPGARAQYRANPALHAYELDDGWKIHRDEYDPGHNPLGHMFFDAPEVPLALFAASAAGLGTYYLLDRMRKDDEDDGAEWRRIALAAGVAVMMGLIVYILGALVRVAAGAG